MKKSMLGAACAGLSLSLSAATVAYWPFGSYGAADAGGKGNHLRINGGVTFADGAACFDGVMAKCRTERPLDLSVCTKGLTVECWVRVPADPERQRHNPAPVRNPVPRDAGTGPEDVELVPMGATNLRLTCFPLGVN